MTMVNRFLLALIAIVASQAETNEAAQAPSRFSETEDVTQQSDMTKSDRRPGLVHLQPRSDRGRRRYIELIRAEAERTDLPVAVADAVAYVESSYDPTRIGDVGEIGLMQIRPATAYMLGFRGSDSQLAEPTTNIRYGVQYLAKAWRLAGGDLCRALMKYRAGHGAESMSLRSVQYCSRARAYLASLQSSLNPDVTQITDPPPASPSMKAGEIPTETLAINARKLAGSSRFWAAHEARIRALTNRVHAKWKRFSPQKRWTA
jgi:soluble lytic murein transglycosylase-like protein